MNDKSEILIVIGFNIRKQRINQGISQNQLAFEAGLTREYINKLEAGKLNATVLNLEKISHVLNLQVQDLFFLVKS